MKVHLRSLSPILWTKDLEQTIAFYVNVLGFSRRSNFPNFASLWKDNVEIMTIVPMEDPGDCKDEADGRTFFAKPCLTGSLFIITENVDELWEKIRDKAIIKSSIADREYAMRDFSILDNNGYELVFGQDISNRNAD